MIRSANFLSQALIVAATLLFTTPSLALFLDGEGHYSLLGETRTSPGFQSDRGNHQAIRQGFRLLGEARMNDRSSFFLEFRLFENPRTAWLGDTAKPKRCAPRYNKKSGTSPSEYDIDTDCTGRHQDTESPGYEPYTPHVTQAFVRYSFDYCLLEVGRRGRDWGLGAFVDSGSDPFEVDSSVYDGATCHINIQKSQTLGFSFGWDRIAETGTRILDARDRPASAIDDQEIANQGSETYGPDRTSDDLDQIFLMITFDDRKANAGSAFTKEIGVYYARVFGNETESYPDVKDDGPIEKKTELNFIDLYTGFYVYDWAFRNEFIFRLGKSADPNWFFSGGKRNNVDGVPSVNNLQSIGVAGEIEWTVAKSGAAIGPSEFHEGTAVRHVIGLQYAIAPGDSDGYYVDDGVLNTQDLGESKRDEKVSAMAFHRNYKPAMLLFNGHPAIDDLRVDGVFDPAQVTNATVLALGYRYESLSVGNFGVKLITARLRRAIPQEVKDAYKDLENRPIGYAGQDLGYELDLKYSYAVGREAELGLGAAAALPGKAWQTRKEKSAANNLALQSFVAFKF